MAVTKDILLRQVDGLRDLARRSRRLAESLQGEADRDRLSRHARELDESADRLEHEAVAARAVQFSDLTARRPVG